MEGILKGLDYDTSRRLRDVSKTHRKHWESIKYQCCQCDKFINPTGGIRFLSHGRCIHLECVKGFLSQGYLFINHQYIYYYKGARPSIVREGDVRWRDYFNYSDDFGLTKEAEELYQKYLKWNN